jgi:hypothetical protein
MLEHREIESILAVSDTGIVALCGRFQEFMAQLTPRSAEAQIVPPKLCITTLRLLLPERWLFR